MADRTIPTPFGSLTIHAYRRNGNDAPRPIQAERGTGITGSFNFSKAAEQSNAENLLVIRDRSLAVKYRQNWNEHSKHAGTYRRKE